MWTIDQLLAFMKQHDASDLYLTVDRAPSYKIQGAVRPAGDKTLTQPEVEALANSVMDAQQRRDFPEKKEMNLAIHREGMGRFRFNIYKQKMNTAIVIRKIETDIKTLDDLKLPVVLKDICMAKRGLILMVGATGSGKSTTLAAMIDHRNRNEMGHIVTIEDPVEFVHDHKKCVISQREVGTDTNSFRDALKSTLRQAPTVILIGEIRDEETMEYALNFAETGHLCLATLHANNANQAMERVINFFPMERHRQLYMQLSLNLQAIISQRLLKGVDGMRVAAIEILLSSSRTRDLIQKAAIAELKEAMNFGKNEGMQTFDQALIYLYKEGRISLEEALGNADSATDLKVKIKLAEGKEGNGEAKEEPKAGFTLERNH